MQCKCGFIATITQSAQSHPESRARIYLPQQQTNAAELVGDRRVKGFPVRNCSLSHLEMSYKRPNLQTRSVKRTTVGRKTTRCPFREAPQTLRHFQTQTVQPFVFIRWRKKNDNNPLCHSFFPSIVIQVFICTFCK